MSETDIFTMRDMLLQEHRESIHGQLAYELECQIKARIVKPDTAISSPFAAMEQFFNVVVSELADLRVEVAALRLELKASENYSYAQRGGQSSTAISKKVSISSHLRPIPTHYHLSFDQRLPVSGWYEVEYSQEGRPFRWLGPKSSSTFEIAISRQVLLELQISIIRSITDEILQSVRILIDGVPVPAEMMRDGQGSFLMKALIQPSLNLDTPPHISLTLEVSECIAPNYLDPSSSDERSISIAVSKITMTANVSIDTNPSRDEDGSSESNKIVADPVILDVVQSEEII